MKCQVKRKQEKDFKKTKDRFIKRLKELNSNIRILTSDEAKMITIYNGDEEVLFPPENCVVLKTELINKEILQVKYNKEEFVVFCQTK